MTDLIKLAALHKHFCIADAVRVVVDAPILKPDEEAEAIKKFGQEFAVLGQHASMLYRMSVWYSLLYVVVEGYRDLKVPFAPLDAVLAKDDYINLLRLFRNATFHYQEDPLSEKLIGFLGKPDSEVWIRDLNKQLQAFCIHVLPIKETLERIEGGVA
jgi:hypothetical protein